MSRNVAVLSLVMVVGLSGCPTLPEPEEWDAGLRDAGRFDAGARDGGPTDAGARDASVDDAGAHDAGALDGGSNDAGLPGDAGGADAGAFDGGIFDAGVFDAGVCAGLPAGVSALDAFQRLSTSNDLPDDLPGVAQIHPLYVTPADRTPTRALDVDGSLRRSLTAMNAWVQARTGSRLRFDTCGGIIDITRVTLDAGFDEVPMAQGRVGTPAGPAYLRDRLERALTRSFAANEKLYLVIYDGLDFGHCGGAPLPPSLLGHMPALFVGGQFHTTFLTAAVSAGASQVTVFDSAQLPLPATPFTAQLGTESLTVTQVSGTQVTLQQPLTQAHAAFEVLSAQTNIPPCRQNPFSPDARQLDYWEFSAAHEVLHALGIVPADAPDRALPPIAPGHLADTSPAGRADVMYQGTQSWSCQTFPPASGPMATPCTLDPGHRNYFATDGGTSVDLAKSVFLEPMPPGAVFPPGW